MKKILRIFTCCKIQYPQWLSHLIYECNTKRKTSQWCNIFIDNYRFLTEFDQDFIAQLHSNYKFSNSKQQLIQSMQNDIDKHNALHITISFFASYIKIKYAQTISPTQVTINRIKKDFEEFLHLLKDCVILFYSLDRLEGLFDSEEFNSKILNNFTIKIIFDNDEFNDTINQIQKKVDKQSNQKIQFNMQKFESLKPQQYGITKQYCLNNNTLKQFNLKSVDSYQNFTAYSQSIELVRQIVKQKYPSSKLNKVQTLINSIEKTIQQFYSLHQIKENTALNADSIISILVYIIVQSKQSNLNSHLKIIKTYINKEALNSSLGYSLASIEACLQFIQKGNIKRSKGMTINQSQLSLWLSLQNYFQTSNTNNNEF